MKRSSIIAWLTCSAWLSACGGGGNTLSTTPAPAGGPTASTVTSLSVSTSAAQIAADGSVAATIAATAKDANNNVVSGATVTFSASAGGLAVTQGTTDANGLATATLRAGGAPVGTAITVTAAAGAVNGKVAVSVIDIKQTIGLITSLPQIPSDSSKKATITALVRDANNNFLPNVTVNFQASSGGLAVTQGVTDAGGAATATLDAAGDPSNRQITVTATTGSATATVPVDVTGTTITITGPANVVQPGSATYSVSLADSSNGGIAGAAIAVTSAKHNGLSAATITTDSTGHASFQLTAVNSGTDTLTATGLGIQALQSVGVSNQSFAISSPAANAHINLGVSQPVVVTWTSAGAPVANQPVSLSTTRGTLSAASATTNAQGQATVSISSSTSGGAVISATGTGVSAQLAVDFIATAPAAVAVQASPSTINTSGKSTITAVVRDAQNNLVEGQTVNFQLTDNTGGSLSTGTTLTNSQGVAETVYTASSTTSATNGVVISATVQGTSVTGSASLTVAGKTVFLSLGTGNLINSLNDAQYSVTYAVQAIDGAGNGVDGVVVDMTTTSLSYIKGSRVWNGTTWATVASTNSANTPCASEDLNHNGILDPGEDVNNNGKLDPGAVASVTPGSVTTAGGGNAIVKVIYPKDHAYYVSVSLTATATVQGTQTSTSTSFVLPGAAADFNTQSNAPPGPVSPYGQGSVCANPN